MTDADRLPALLTENIAAASFRRATFAGPVRGSIPCPWRRIELAAILHGGRRRIRASYFDERRDLSRMLTADELPATIEELLGWSHANIHIETGEATIDIRLSKKGKLLVNERKMATTGSVPVGHNRTKDVAFPDDRPHRLLQLLGIAAADGQIKPTMRAKYRQVNEFLKHLRHALPSSRWAELGRPVRILDAGCGSSYLTFAVHHDLNENLKIPAELLGIDSSDEAIRKSAARADELAGSRLAFERARLSEVQAKPDIVLSLHACDTATDDALALAVRSGAEVILSVPCCHHHLNEQLAPVESASILRPILRHGLLLQRTADILTDTFRAQILSILGYRTDIVEFVATEHTPRNLMIRATKRPAGQDRRAMAEYAELKRFFGATPYLEELLAVELKVSETCTDYLATSVET